MNVRCEYSETMKRILFAAALAITALGLVASGTVQLPDLEHALTELSETLGTWTYALVGGLAFLETGAFVGLIAPGETAIVLGGVVAAEATCSLRRSCCSHGWAPRWET